MALQCKTSCSSGALRAISMAKELLQGSNGCWRWRRILLLLWVLSGVFLSIYVFDGLKDGYLSTRKEKIADEDKLNSCILQEQFKVSNDQVHTLATQFSKSDQKKCQNMLQSGEARQPYEKLCIIPLQIGWWVLLGIAVNCKYCVFPSMWTNSNQQLLRQQQQQHGSKFGGRWRRKLLVLWVLVGMILSMWLFWSMNARIILWRKTMLANMCDARPRMLQDEFNVSKNHLHALAILVSAFHHGKNPSSIDQKTFAVYTERTAFQRPLTGGVVYALKVLHADRERFEKQSGWTIKKMATEDQSLGRHDPSPVQDEYAPAVFSQHTVSHIVSLDMMSGKEDCENILGARASGKGVLTSPLKLIKSKRLGVVLTFAVYNMELPADAALEERIAATQGYLGAYFDISSLVKKLLHQLASKKTIVVNVYDMTNSSAPINMYGPLIKETGIWHLSNLDFGDPFRKHGMHCRFNQKPPLPWSAITTSVVVLVFFAFVGHIFHRIAKVKDDYSEIGEQKVLAEAADVAKSQWSIY